MSTCFIPALSAAIPLYAAGTCVLTSEVRACSSDAHAAKAISAAAFLSGVFVRAIRYDGSRHWLQRFCNFLITLVESGVAATAGCGAGVAVHPAKAAIPNSTTRRDMHSPFPL